MLECFAERGGAGVEDFVFCDHFGNLAAPWGTPRLRQDAPKEDCHKKAREAGRGRAALAGRILPADHAELRRGETEWLTRRREERKVRIATKGRYIDAKV